MAQNSKTFTSPATYHFGEVPIDFKYTMTRHPDRICHVWDGTDAQGRRYVIQVDNLAELPFLTISKQMWNYNGNLIESTLYEECRKKDGILWGMDYLEQTVSLMYHSTCRPDFQVTKTMVSNFR